MATITGIVTLDETDILEVDADPSAGAGTPAAIGSIAIVKLLNGLWQKTAAGNTAWANIASPKGWLQYSNSANQSTTAGTGTYTALTLDTDRDSFPNSLFTKSSATQFRTDFAGYVQIGYKAQIQSQTNSRPVAIAVIKDGTPLTWTEQRTLTFSNTNRYSSVAGDIIVACSNGSLFQLGFHNSEVVTTIDIFAEQASMFVSALYRTS